MSNTVYGYSGLIADILREKNISIGDRIVIKKNNVVYTGLLMPRSELYSDKPIIVIKLDNGYNIGIRIDENTSIELIEKTKESFKKTRRGELIVKLQNENLPRVSLLSTGGTIVSKVDYETGAVKPALSVDEILEWIPEIGDIAYINAREIMNVFSENIESSHWEYISREIYKEMVNGVDGVVVAHGTDFMAYTASAIAFAIRNKPVPVVFVGSQRSSDRPSTDSALNLLSAFIAASKSPFSESVIVMHGETSDTYALAHRGVKSRKMHSSRRDAFQSINDRPLAIIYPYKREIKVINNNIYEFRNKDKEPVLENKFDNRVALIYFYPGLDTDLIEYFIDKKYHGLVIAGSGLGHVSERLINTVKRAVEEEIPVVMTTQCLFGRVNMNVYSTGRRLIEAGVIPGQDMLPEAAFVKLSWILGSRTRDLREVAYLIQSNIVGEINTRLTIDLYPKWVF
ncbi:MAG: Glu-tRNA(Gln) amidotransferase subunit GatD [Desulfurococcaceae archaeon]